MENDALGNYVTADTVINNPDAHTLVAQWENGTNTQYTVERYVEKAADGNSDGTDTENSDTATKEYALYDKSIGYGTTNEDVVIDASLYGIAGYAFDENNLQNVLTGTIKADGSTVFALYYNIKPADCFTVTYDYGRDDMPYKTLYVKDGETYGLPDIGKTTDDHMKLVGWRDDIGVFNGNNATINHSDAHYTAVWEKDEYTVFYRLSNADFATQTYSYNDTDKLMGELFLLDPVKDENGNIIKYYKFAGWNTRRTSPESSSFTSLRILAVPSSMAMWLSWPQACILPSLWEAKGRPVSSLTGRASISARSATVLPGLPP